MESQLWLLVVVLVSSFLSSLVYTQVEAASLYNTICDIESAEAQTGRPWHSAFIEDFDGSELNTSIWTARVSDEVGHFTDLEYYLPENVEVEDGLLLIHSRREEYKQWNYTSGWVDSNSKLGVQYGRVCIRARMPAQQPGYWPALWLMPLSETCWPGAGEVDILEMLNGDGVVRGTYHYSPRYRKDNCTLASELATAVSLFSGPDFGDGFHEYAVEWTHDRLTYYMDGRPYLSTYISDTHGADGVPHTPMYVIVNSALGGWAGPVSNTTDFPITHAVDYIRVIQPGDDDEHRGSIARPGDKRTSTDSPAFRPSTLAVLQERKRKRTMPHRHA